MIRWFSIIFLLLAALATPASAAVAISNTDHNSAQVTNGTSTVTISAMAIGAAAADRLVFIVLGWFDLGAAIQANPTSVTIGGITATQAVVSNTGGVFTPALYEYWAAVPTGTTANVVVNFSANADTSDYIGVSVYRVVGANTSTPVSATATTNTTSPTQAVSTSITVPANGALICGGSGLTASGSVSWTNATLDTNFSGVLSSDEYSSASSTTATTSTRTYNDSGGASVNAQVVCTAIQQAAGAAVATRKTLTGAGL